MVASEDDLHGVGVKEGSPVQMQLANIEAEVKQAVAKSDCVFELRPVLFGFPTERRRRDTGRPHRGRYNNAARSSEFALFRPNGPRRDS